MQTSTPGYYHHGPWRWVGLSDMVSLHNVSTHYAVVSVPSSRTFSYGDIGFLRSDIGFACRIQAAHPPVKPQINLLLGHTPGIIYISSALDLMSNGMICS